MPRPKTGRAPEFYLAIRVGSEMNDFLNSFANKSEWLRGLILATPEWQEWERKQKAIDDGTYPSLFEVKTDTDE